MEIRASLPVRKPLFERRARVEQPVLEPVTERETATYGIAGFLAGPVTGLALATLTDLAAGSCILISALVGSAGMMVGIGLGVWLEERNDSKREANAVRLRKFEAETRYQPTTGLPESPWPRVEALAGEKSAALKSLLGQDEAAALSRAIENLPVQLDKTAAQLLERPPGKLACQAQLPEGQRVRIDTVTDLRRLDLAYGHSDPPAYATALNSLLDQGYTLTPSLRVEPDSQSTQSRYEAFRLVEHDRSATVDAAGALQMSLHQDLLANEFFVGSGQDHGLADPWLAQRIKSAYAKGVAVFNDYRKLETPLDAYRSAMVNGPGELSRTGQREAVGLPLSASLQEFLDWETAAARHLTALNIQLRGTVKQLYHLTRGELTCDASARSFATIHGALLPAVDDEAINIFKRLLANSESAEELQTLAEAFAREPQWRHREGVWNQREDFERHTEQALGRVLATREVVRLARPQNRLQRGIQEAGDVVLVGGTRIPRRA